MEEQGKYFTNVLSRQQRAKVKEYPEGRNHGSR